MNQFQTELPNAIANYPAHNLAVTPMVEQYHPNVLELNRGTNAASSALLSSLKRFESHGLADLHNANLMNRVDSKFVLPISLLPELLNQLTEFYSVLEIDGKRISTYRNQYFDTHHMRLYQDHHNGKLNRYKVRRRHYVDTDTRFLEVKFKNNQKRTIKSRLRLTGSKDERKHCAQFVQQQMGGEELALEIRQQSGYQRIALANEATAERLTIDFQLWYQDSRGGSEIKLPNFFIAELKQAKKSKRSVFYQLMSANTIFPIAFSKYCIGCALMYKSLVKTNRFKATLSRIEKLNQRPISPSFHL